MNVLIATFLLLVVVLVLRLKFELWIFEKKAGEVLDLFAQNGAFSPLSAIPANDLGLSLSIWRFGLRDYRSEAFRSLLARGLLLMTTDGRFYLSDEGYRVHMLNHRDPDAR